MKFESSETRPRSQVLLVTESGAPEPASLKYHLENEGFIIRTLSETLDIVRQASKIRPALIILESEGEDGVKICREIRKSPDLATTPVILISSRGTEESILESLESGADDFLARPFSARELAARARAVLRRTTASRSRELLRAGEITLDSAAIKVTVGEEGVEMSLREFRLLEFLMRHSGRTFSRLQLMRSVWKGGNGVTQRSVDVYVRRVREKIEAEPHHPRYLRTVRGVGYRFDVPAAAG